MYKIVLLACFLVPASSLEGISCQTTADCDVSECCQTLHTSLIVSKKDLDLDLLKPVTGACRKYNLEGAACDIFSSMYGYCGCAPGLHCNMHQVPINSRMIMAPQPGMRWESKCIRN